VPIEYPDIAWPPAHCEQARPFYQEHGAWYSGDLGRLARVYGGAVRSDPVAQEFFGADTGTRSWPGAKNLLRTFWHGKQPTPGQNTTKLHVPAAADVSRLSAAMLYAEPPAFTVPDVSRETTTPDGLVVVNPTQERLEEILDLGGAYPVLQAQAEQGSAYGGMFVRASVDTTISDVPLLDALIPDNAIPVFRRGRLAAVTFWREVRTDGSKVWRHLERHEVEGQGPAAVGYVEHAVYLGTRERLGTRVPLNDGDEECQHFATLVDINSRIVTGASVLDVDYLPNVRPHRMIRGSDLGRSDYQGNEGAMDALDETWSSLIRDMRNGKGRIFAPREYFQSGGAGRGASFDTEQEVFTLVNKMGGDNPLQMDSVQFEIRVQQHLEVARGLWAEILKGVGLGQDSMGEGEGGERTAKEVGKHGERASATRLEKIGYQLPGLRRLGLCLLQLDAVHYRTPGIVPSPVNVEFPDTAGVDAESNARTLQLLDAAGAVSTKTKVAMLHGDWTEQQIDDEVMLIDGAKTVEDPGTFDPGAPPADPAPDDDQVQEGDE
jgi:hypothetical protein